MKDIMEILQRKENDLVRLTKEIEALHFVIPLLIDETEESMPDMNTEDTGESSGIGERRKNA